MRFTFLDTRQHTSMLKSAPCLQSHKTHGHGEMSNPRQPAGFKANMTTHRTDHLGEHNTLLLITPLTESGKCTCCPPPLSPEASRPRNSDRMRYLYKQQCISTHHGESSMINKFTLPPRTHVKGHPRNDEVVPYVSLVTASSV